MSQPARDPRRLPRAVALKYDRAEQPAPRIAAKGTGEIARAILELARQNGVPVRQDPDLLELLARCDLGAEIPAELYRAVAELLAYLYRLNADSPPVPRG